MDEEVVIKEFGKRLAKLRKELNISQEKMAFEVGVDRTYISLLERGLRNPTLKKLWKISNVLKISLSKLLDS